ncbi:MAG TPA: trehalose-phosphatase [Candidatus Limnocylindria bacterium]|nr:trehalose-phosphatase [Candidatus Limnocylindria bacterium]
MPNPPAAPRTAAGRAGLAAVLERPDSALLACDYDGTLAPIVVNPAAAAPQPGAIQVLTSLAGLLGTVAIVTGRPAETAVRLGGLDGIPGVVVLGSYGAERWASGALLSSTTARLPSGVEAAVALVVGRLPGVRVEDKGTAVAVHVRECPDPRAAQAHLLEPLESVAQEFGLTVEPGRFVVELRAPGTDKGAALRLLALERSAHAVVFIGDDLGDLAAFAEVAAMRHSGGPAGLTIASSSMEAAAVAAAADLVLDGPAGVVTWLESLRHALLTEH